MSVDLAGVRLRNPVLLAAGTSGTLAEFAEVLDPSTIGGAVCKSITAEPRAGNPDPRILGMPAGMINAIGLANPGVDAFVRDHAPLAERLDCVNIASVAGFAVEDYVTVASALAQLPGFSALELNVSCPNVGGHGAEFGADPGSLREVVSAVSAVSERDGAPGKAPVPLFVKLSPILVGTPHTIVDLCRAAIDAGASGLTLCNTSPGMGIDVKTRRPIIANVTGGISGPGVHPMVVKIVHDAYRGVCREAGVPIIAVGGVLRWEDAAEFILAGASAVQVGTGSYVHPGRPAKVARGLARWVRSQGTASVAELVGAVRLPGSG